ncbi:MAG: hypothetical protein Q9180_008808 [Flavoplaca navasiana]
MDTALSVRAGMISSRLAVQARHTGTDQHMMTVLLVVAALRTIIDRHAMNIPPVATARRMITVRRMEIVPLTVAQHTVVLPATTPHHPTETEIPLVATLVTLQLGTTIQLFGPTNDQLARTQGSRTRIKRSDMRLPTPTLTPTDPAAS